MNSVARKVVWLATAAALAVPLVAMAQAATPGACPGGCAQGAGRGPGGRHGAHMWDPKALTTVQGDIVSVDTELGRRHQGVHLTLAVGSEKLLVVVGPSFYVDQQPVKLAQGDRVEVTGSRITRGDQAMLVAQEIKKGNDVLSLRDADGIPLWSPMRAQK